MNKEIYEKLKYQIEEKDRQREQEKNKFFNDVDKNTRKVYYKIWSKILDDYKNGGLDSINFDLRLRMRPHLNERYNVMLYIPVDLDGELVGIDLIDLEKLANYLTNDSIDLDIAKCVSPYGGEHFKLMLHISEDSLRSIESSQKNNYPSERVIKSSVKSTKIKGK